MMDQHPVGMTLRDSSETLQKGISQDILYPEFYHEFAEFDKVELIMG